MTARTAEEERFRRWLVEQGCQLPGCCNEGNFHHEVYLSQGGNHMSGICLCYYHHQDQKAGRHAMARERFNEMYGVDVLKLAAENRERYESQNFD